MRRKCESFKFLLNKQTKTKQKQIIEELSTHMDKIQQAALEKATGMELEQVDRIEAPVVMVITRDINTAVYKT